MIDNLSQQPFSLDYHDRSNIKKITEEIMDKVNTFERVMSGFYGEWQETANSVRMLSRMGQKREGRGLFNSKSGETNRAVTTLSSLWFRMLTASDPYIETFPRGLSPDGTEITEEQLYAMREVLIDQATYAKYKPKLKKVLSSLAAFGSVIVEKPFVSLPLGSPDKFYEYTDFQQRSLLQCGFDPFVFDLDSSDYIYTIDFPTKYKLREYANSNNDVWFKSFIEKVIEDQKLDGSIQSDSYNRISERKQKAGYNNTDDNIFELINYHGKLDINNPIFEDYWEKNGRPDDIRFTDWTVGLLNTSEIVRFHTTAYGSWHYLFETAHYNQFELEPLGYGVGKLGKKLQRELDVTQSRAQDALMMGIYMMNLVGKFAGLKSSQLNIKPFNIIELEDVSQFKQLQVDMQTINQSLAMQGLIKEDFRSITQASTNLQAQATNATATEASLTQTEAIRGNSVTAEIIAETLVRGYFNTAALNNYYLLDSEIFVNLTGSFGQLTKGFNRNNLPLNVGIKTKTTTDKDYRPERIQKVLELINLSTSIRNIMPDSLNAIEPLLTEAFRLVGVDPRVLRKPKPLYDQMTERMQRMGKSNIPEVGNEIQSEIGDEQSGNSTITTPVGDVPTSPVGSFNQGI